MHDKEDNHGVSLPLIVEQKENGRDIENNESTRTTSFVKTCFHGINALSGVGILSIPYALASGGWLSLILFFIIASTTFYSSLLIQRCMDIDINLRTYPDIGYKAFGNKGRLIISIFTNLELYLVGTGFLILEGDNLDKLFPSAGFHLLGIELRGKQMFIILVALIVLPSVWLDDMSILSYVSASGAFASGAILASVFWYGAIDGTDFENTGSEMINVKGIATSVSLYAFCYCAHPVFPTLYTSMNNKGQFSKVMIICFTLCTFMYASMAVLGYMMFGSKVQSQITLDLPIEKLSSKIAIYTTLVNPVAKYALMVTPIINALKSQVSGFGHKKGNAGLIFGTPLVTSNVVVALLLPFFGNLMTLVGAFFSVSASVILPCLCYLKISESYRRFGFEMLLLIGIILTGTIVVITGTYQSILDIIGQF